MRTCVAGSQGPEAQKASEVTLFLKLALQASMEHVCSMGDRAWHVSSPTSKSELTLSYSGLLSTIARGDCIQTGRNHETLKRTNSTSFCRVVGLSP